MSLRHGSLFALVACIGMMSGFGAARAGDVYSIPWHTVDAGGGRSTSPGGYAMTCSIGQPDAGELSGGGYTLLGGFLPGPLPTPAGPGDCDNDGDIDLADYAELQNNCFTGTKDAPSFPGFVTGCECSDFDDDLDVDLIDALKFQAVFTGN